MEATQAKSSFDYLQGERYISLTTYRRTGAPVPTPVWFAEEGGLLYVVTQAESGKVKRLRHTPEVSLAPCTVRGQVTGDSVQAIARILPETDNKRADRVLNKKYGWQKKLFELMSLFSRAERVYLEIRPV